MAKPFKVTINREPFSTFEDALTKLREIRDAIREANAEESRAQLAESGE